MNLLPALPRSSITNTSLAAKLDSVQKSLGLLPNLFRVFANSPVALDAYLGLAGAAAGGRLDARQRESIALAVAQRNDCDYCLAAHGALGAGAGLDVRQIHDARHARADAPGDQRLLELARRIVETQGKVPVSELQAFKDAGHDDAAILEVLVNVVLNIYTNYTNHLARTEIDFPRLPQSAAA